MEDELRDLRVGHPLDVGGRREVALDRLLADRGEVEALAVVGDLDRDRAALVVGGEADRAAGGLAGLEALVGGLDAVIGRVAHHVGERVLDDVEHLAVEFGLGARHHEVDALAEFGREVAHDAGQLLPRIADRLHARLHHAFLQLGRDVAEALERDLVAGILVAAGDLEELVAGQHQFRDHRHQVLDGVDVHADRLNLGHRAFTAPFGHGRRGRGALVSLGGCRRLRRALEIGLGGFEDGLDRGRGGRRRDGRGSGRSGQVVGAGRFHEGALQIFQRDLAGLQLTLHDRRQIGQRRGRRSRGGGRLLGGHRLQGADQVGIGAGGLGTGGFEIGEDRLEPVEGGEDQGDRGAADGIAVAEAPHQRLGRVCQRFEPRQPEEAAGALDGVDEPEDVAQDLLVVGILLETDQLRIDRVQMLGALDQKLAKQIVHGGYSSTRTKGRATSTLALES